MKLHAKWFLSLATVFVALLVIINVSLDISLPGYLRARIRSDLERDARLLIPLSHRTPELNDAARAWAKDTGLRITIMRANGDVFAESDAPLGKLDNHLYRPEVQSALANGVGSATRPSDTLHVDLMYVAVRDADQIVRVAIPLTEVAGTVRRVRLTVALASIVVAFIALPVMFWLARRTSEPIDAMRRMATRVAAGDFTGHAPEHLTGEVGELAHALNQMSTQLETRLNELTSEKSHLAGILAGMTEGVLVVDAAGKIRLMNQALRQAFALTDDALGRTVAEVFRHGSLDLSPGQRELTFLQPTERTYIVNIGALDAASVIVFHDITRLKQLENMRKDFVANVSHELRTPLSIIKGYVETLLDPEPPDAATSRQFLETIERHSRRLEALVDDLLSISALESQQAQLHFAPVSLRATVKAVVEELGREVVVEMPDFQVRADAQRLYQVFVNLVGNAIKYTPAGSKIEVSAVREDSFVKICVTDNGPGIAAEHLPRIFERFYRVDKARSRELGGTGLGLAIVKHIVQAHGGRVWVESELGKGSHFFVTIPSV